MKLPPQAPWILALLIVLVFYLLEIGKTEKTVEKVVYVTQPPHSDQALRSSGEACKCDPISETVAPVPSFYDLAVEVGTDKVTTHTYDSAYEKYLPLLFKKKSLKFLEVGLGCNMNYGPGASMRLWLEYFKDLDLELHFMEYEEKCATAVQKQYPNVRIHQGDQANLNDLQKIIDAAGPDGFDAIVEDGGHSMKQMIVTLETLFPKALKPGGIYFMEDTVCSWTRQGFINYQDYGGRRAITEAFSLMEDMTFDFYKNTYPLLFHIYGNGDVPNPETNKLYRIIKSVDCHRSICVFTKLDTPDKLRPNMKDRIGNYP